MTTPTAAFLATRYNLTCRESIVAARLCATGDSDKAIATALDRSEHTISTQVLMVMVRAGARSRTHFVVAAWAAWMRASDEEREGFAPALRLVATGVR